MKILYRGRRYSQHGHWRTWYEPCPVVKVTKKFIMVESEDFPETPLYRGGKFQINRADIELKGRTIHTRHGEWFYVEPQSDSFPFPSKDILEMPDFVTMEAKQIGWDTDKSLHEWEDWQRNCWLFATLLKKPLREIVDRWKYGGESAVQQMWRECREEHDRHIAGLLEKTRERSEKESG